jgi:hypothetical protein
VAWICPLQKTGLHDDGDATGHGFTCMPPSSSMVARTAMCSPVSILLLNYTYRIGPSIILNSIPSRLFVLRGRGEDNPAG